jgi:hypothetical protein
VRKLMAYVAALGAAPIVAIALMQTAVPVLADTPGVSPTCFPQTANPHPTDPAGTTTNTLFCTPTNSNATGSGGTGSGKSGTGAGTKAGGGQTTLASSSGTGSVPDESGHAGAGRSGTSAGAPAASTDRGLFGGLVGFFASAGGLALLFGLLMLMLIVLIALAVVAWMRHGGKNFASRFSRVTYRA